jgi:hypothetical protein
MNDDLRARAEAFYAGVSENIQRTGRACISILEAETPFTYTIGNHLAGRPELIVFGMDPRQAGEVLNLASELPPIAEAEDGAIVSLGGVFGLKVVRCGSWAKESFSIQATRYLGTSDYELVQLLVPDPFGRFPGDPGCEPVYDAQPILTRKLN